MTVEDARQLRSELLALTDRLVYDLEWVPAGRVIAVVVACRFELARVGVHRDGLLAATEACVRTRLASTPVSGPV